MNNMAKFISGIKRKKTNEMRRQDSSELSSASAVMLLVGAVSVSVMLTVCLAGADSGDMFRDGGYAVMAMSGAVENENADGSGTEKKREELVVPSAAEEEKWNLYDYIGELFAGLISD